MLTQENKDRVFEGFRTMDFEQHCMYDFFICLLADDGKQHGASPLPRAKPHMQINLTPMIFIHQFVGPVSYNYNEFATFLAQKFANSFNANVYARPYFPFEQVEFELFATPTQPEIPNAVKN